MWLEQGERSGQGQVIWGLWVYVKCDGKVAEGCELRINLIWLMFEQDLSACWLE